MSTNWSASFGYGFKIDKKAVLDDNYDEFIDDLNSCIGKRYPLLDIGYGGSPTTGEGYEEWVFIKDSIIQADGWAVEFTLEELTKALDEDNLDQLYAFSIDTGILVGKPAWRMMITAS